MYVKCLPLYTPWPIWCIGTWTLMVSLGLPGHAMESLTAAKLHARQSVAPRSDGGMADSWLILMLLCLFQVPKGPSTILVHTTYIDPKAMIWQPISGPSNTIYLHGPFGLVESLLHMVLSKCAKLKKKLVQPVFRKVSDLRHSAEVWHASPGSGSRKSPSSRTWT